MRRDAVAATLKMLYGPPGTGKTWQAAREAVRAIEPAQYHAAASSSNPEAALQAAHKALVNEGRILWVTFHPSYSYEDFMEGYRPVLLGGAVTYKVVDGPFKKLCERVRKKVDLEVGDRIDSAPGRDPFEIVDVDAGGWVLRVRPNRSDEVAEYLDKYVPRRVVEDLLTRGFAPEIFSIAGATIYNLPFMGISATDPDLPAPGDGETTGTRKGPVLRKVIAARTGVLSSSDLSNSSHFGAVMRRLQQIRAASEPAKPVALVIDEFNRADPSRVFGELLTLIELDKREGAPEERQVWLPHSQRTFSVPPSVSVIGTMNTVDKSLAPIDFAMRRRFRFEYVGADPSLLETDFDGVNLSDLLRLINARLGALLGSGYEIGHSFFLAAKLGDVSERMGWAGDSDWQMRAIAYVLRSSVLPTVSEYFHEDWAKTRAVLGETVVGGNTVSLFDAPAVEESFIERLPEDYELVDGRVSYPADWWNPVHSAWDVTRFRDFLAALTAGA